MTGLACSWVVGTAMKGDGGRGGAGGECHMRAWRSHLGDQILLHQRCPGGRQAAPLPSWQPSKTGHHLPAGGMRQVTQKGHFRVDTLLKYITHKLFMEMME